MSVSHSEETVDSSVHFLVFTPPRISPVPAHRAAGCVKPQYWPVPPAGYELTEIWYWVRVGGSQNHILSPTVLQTSCSQSDFWPQFVPVGSGCSKSSTGHNCNCVC